VLTPLRKPRHILGLAALAASVSLVTAACGGSGGGSGADGPVTLTISATTYFQPVLPTVISDFEASHPGVKVTATYTPSSNYSQLIGTQLSNGTAADIVSVSPGSGNAESLATLGKQGYLADLSDQPWVSKIPAAYKQYVTLNGKVYLPPIATFGEGAIYNESELSALGLTPPTTWDQALAFCKAARAKGKYAFGVGAETDYENQILVYTQEATLVGNTMPDFIQDRLSGKVTFSNTEWVTAFEQEKTLQDDGCIAPDPDGTNINAVESALANGQILGFFGQSLQLPSVTALAPSNKFGFSVFPATNDDSQTRMPIAIEGSLGINAKIPSNQMQDAKDFISFLMTGPEVAKIASGTYTVPVIPDPDFKPTAAGQVQMTAQQTGKFTMVADQLFPNANVRLTWISENEQLLDGAATPTDVTEAMDKVWSGS
jgi:ABC-type glycerol-3-phosphate transport system substrate-binding protein